MRQKYVPDIAKNNAIQEQNYSRLLTLMNNWQQRSNWTMLLYHPVYHQVSISILQRFKFTTAVQFEIHSQHKMVTPLCLNLRLYHDVCMAEVVACEHGSQLAGSYPYPNADMRQVNEKEQLNGFLRDWLLYCVNNATSDTKFGFNGEKT